LPTGGVQRRSEGRLYRQDRRASDDIGSSYIVVDTVPWIFGKKVMLPASTIERIDYDNETVYVAVTKERINNAPEFEATTHRDTDYRSRLGSYYDRDF